MFDSDVLVLCLQDGVPPPGIDTSGIVELDMIAKEIEEIKRFGLLMCTEIN